MGFWFLGFECVCVVIVGKTTKRAGWVKRDVKDPESIADHMYRMGLMALIASDIPGVNRDKLSFEIEITLYFDCIEFPVFSKFRFCNISGA